MKQMRLYNRLPLLAAAALLLPAGCTKDLRPADAGAITVEASIGAPTKVAYDGDKSSFASGDQIAVYAWTGSSTEVPATRVVDGVVNTFDGSAWTPASLMRWKSETDAHYFLGVSPVRSIASFTEDAFSLTPGDFTASDLLIATNTGGVTASGGPVALGFSHVMAKLDVNLNFRSQWGGTPTVTSVNVTAKSSASVNYLAKAVTATGTAAAVSLTALESPASGFARSYSGLQVPQSGVRQIVVRIGDADFVYEAGENIPLVPGKVTTVNLIVGRDKIVPGGLTITDWVSGDPFFSGELKPNDYSQMPLTFEALEAGAKVTFTLASGVTGPVQYSTDGSAWTDYVSGTPITLTNVGDVVMFRGDNAGYSVSFSESSNFKCSAPCSVYGNIMSLVSSTDFSTATTLTADYTFSNLFQDNAYLRSDASRALVLPATTLAVSCYAYMFYGCTGLSSVPALSATTLADGCYNGMFQGCTGLSSAPALPATELADGCYSHMFYCCTSLSSAPALPAATLADGCYHSMFYGCTSLSSAPALPATTLADGCYYTMFYGCTSLSSAPALPATTLAYACYNGMFYGCTSLSSAPALPATTLTENCYKSMFSYCSSLNSITCAATDISATDCTFDWLDGVADSGTFIGSSKAGWEPNSVSGIPSGWTLADSSLPLTFKALEAGAQVNFTLSSGVTGPVQYSTDGSTWTDYSSETPITLTNVGDIVMFRGDNAGYYVAANDRSNFKCSAPCSVYGNIMSLVSSTDFATATTLTADFTFSNLFRDNAYLRSDASKALVLPATTLANACYFQMFFGCASLISAPALPATTLADNCYAQMFLDCSSLTSAPVLPATTLANDCYYFMFFNCRSLNSITCAATDISATGCTAFWLDSVAASGTFSTPSSTAWSSGSSGIPAGWTRVDLP